MARLNLTRSRILGIGIATAALALAACGHSNSTPAVTVTPTPVSVVTTSASSAPCTSSLGIAYEPDGGNGNGFSGIQVSHYEGNAEYLCTGVGPTSTPSSVKFASSVGEFTISEAGSDGVIDAVAALKNGSGGYSLVQDILGATGGNLTPAGTPYDASVQPPTPTPSAGSTASASSPAPVIPDITSVTTINGGSEGVALVAGPLASPAGIVAVTSLENGPPQYGLSVLYSEPTYSLQPALSYPHSIVRLAGATTTSGTVAFARGQYDLLSFAVTSSGIGYQFNLEAQDTNLGTGSATTRGNGDIAFDPENGSRALLGGTTNFGQSVLTLVDGLPGAITEVSALSMPSTINSIAITENGLFGAVATNDGIVIVSSVNGTTLAEVAPFAISPLSVAASAISYVNCNGTVSKMTQVYSVGFAPTLVPGSTVSTYLVALGTSAGVSCPSGNNATLVALPFDTVTGTVPTPSPTPTVSPTPAPLASGATPSPTPSPSPPPVFVQNNMIAPPAGADLLVVR